MRRWARRLARGLDRRLQELLRRRFDRRFGGAEIAGWGYLEEHGLGHADRTGYGWSPWPPIRAALRRQRPGPADVFADLGCGKGQVILLAGELPFAAVVGVEIAADWAETARRNVARAGARLTCPDVRVDTGDVLAWPVPDDLSVVYMYCPFIEDVFAGTVDRLLASLDEHPRRLRLVLNYPWEHNRLLATGRAAVVDVRCARFPPRPRWWMAGEVIVTYELHPPGAPPPPPRLPLRPGRRAALRRWSAPNDTRFVFEHPAPGAPPRYSDA